MSGVLPAWVPQARGRITQNAAIGPMTWFQVGGPAEILFRPADTNDLAAFLRALPAEIPVTVIGVGSNLLVRDGGVAGVVIRLGRGFVETTAESDALRVGAGALDLNVALTAAEAGIGGLEFLSGIPGTIGGGFRTNAGAYGSEFKDVLVEAEAVDRVGRVHRVTPAELRLSYRRSDAPADWIFTHAVFRGVPGDKEAIGARLAEIRAAREASQPIRARTGGSTFANPPGHQAWKLIDEAGCRGLRQGAAVVSEKHTNFLINTDNATAQEIEELGEEVRRRVRAKSGVTLEWEIRRIGSEAVGHQANAPAMARAG